MTYEARIFKNDNNKYNIYANVDGEELVLGITISEQSNIFYTKWDTREDAIKYIENNSEKLTLVETLKLEDLDKRICDVEKGACNTQTYREFIEEGLDEFEIGPCDFKNEKEVNFYLDYIDELWGK